MPRVIFHPAYAGYDFGPEHPFNPARTAILLDLLRGLGVAPELVTPAPVTPEKLLAVHDADYVRVVEAVSCGAVLAEAAELGLGSTDNPIVSGMAEAARWQVGGTLHGARLIADGEARRVLHLGGGFHHARPRLASGFCLYNDLALAIRHFVGRGMRVAYVDIDVHHGDGVQEICYEDENVLTLSLHESGEYLFPGSGWPHELGRGMGRGLKLNVPLEPFTEGDSYLDALERVSEPAFEFFRPDVVVVQAGADAHNLDPLADLMLTTRDYERIFRAIIELIDRFASGRALFTLGGGYSLHATPRVWAVLYLVLAGLPIPAATPESWRTKWSPAFGDKIPHHLHDPADAFAPAPRRAEITSHNRAVVDRLLDSVARYWL